MYYNHLVSLTNKTWMYKNNFETLFGDQKSIPFKILSIYLKGCILVARTGINKSTLIRNAQNSRYIIHLLIIYDRCNIFY